jgi:hypothetical protein
MIHVSQKCLLTHVKKAVPFLAILKIGIVLSFSFSYTNQLLRFSIVGS